MTDKSLSERLRRYSYDGDGDEVAELVNLMHEAADALDAANKRAITDDDRRTIVQSEHNAAAAEGYHKALVKMQAERDELRRELDTFKNHERSQIEVYQQRNAELREVLRGVIDLCEAGNGPEAILSYIKGREVLGNE